MSIVTLANPTVDCVFKRIFGEIEEILADLICSVKKWPAGHIKNLTYCNTDCPQQYEDDKSCRMDLIADLSTGEKVLVEVQIGRQNDYAQRSLFYFSRSYVSGLESGGKYGQLKKVIGIHILCFNLF